MQRPVSSPARALVGHRSAAARQRRLAPAQAAQLPGGEPLLRAGGAAAAARCGLPRAAVPGRAQHARQRGRQLRRRHAAGHAQPAAALPTQVRACALYRRLAMSHLPLLSRMVTPLNDCPCGSCCFARSCPRCKSCTLHRASGLDEAHVKAALRWLAAFHAACWGADAKRLGLWEQGCYWHLETRQAVGRRGGRLVQHASRPTWQRLAAADAAKQGAQVPTLSGCVSALLAG